MLWLLYFAISSISVLLFTGFGLAQNSTASDYLLVSCNKTVFVGDQVTCIAYFGISYFGNFEINQWNTSQRYLTFNFTSSDQSVISSHSYEYTHNIEIGKDFYEDRIELTGLVYTTGLFNFEVIETSTGLSSLSASNFYRDAWVELKGPQKVLTGQKLYYEAKISTIYPNETYYFIYFYPNSSLTFSTIPQTIQFGDVSAAYDTQNAYSPNCCNYYILRNTEFETDVYLKAFEVQAISPGIVIFQVVTFDFCGIAINCRNYLYNERNSRLNMNFIKLSKKWIFNVIMGLNTLYLEDTEYFPRGSMVVWISNDGAGLAYETNPQYPDFLWENTSLFHMKTDLNYARVLVRVLCETYLNLQLFGIYTYFPKPNNYTISTELKVRSRVIKSKYIITISDDPTISFYCLSSLSLNTYDWLNCTIWYMAQSKLNTWIYLNSSIDPTDKIENKALNTSYQSYYGVLQNLNTSEVQSYEPPISDEIVNQFILLNTEILNDTTVVAIQLNAIIPGPINISFVGFSSCEFLPDSCSTYLNLMRNSIITDLIYEAKWTFTLDYGVNYLQLPEAQNFKKGTMILLEMWQGVVAIANYSSTTVANNDFECFIDDSGYLSLLRELGESDSIAKTYFQVIVVAKRYLYVNSQRYVKQLNMSGNYKLTAVIFDEKTSYVRTFNIVVSNTLSTTSTTTTNVTSIITTTSITNMPTNQTTNYQTLGYKKFSLFNTHDVISYFTSSKTSIQTSDTNSRSSVQKSTRQNDLYSSNSQQTQSSAYFSDVTLGTSTQTTTDSSTANLSTKQSEYNATTISNTPIPVSQFFLSNGSLDWVLVKTVFSTYAQDLTGCIVNCSNHGHCILNNQSLLVCACLGSYVGSSCQTNSQPCSTKPCLNNGTCLQNYDPTTKEYNYTCTCDNYHFGSRCEKSVDLCANKTCSGNGRCVVNASSMIPVCECFQMYSGSVCEIESQTLAKIKQVISTASIVAILSIVLSYVLIALIDLHTLLTAPEKFLLNKKLPRVKEPETPKKVKIEETENQNQIQQRPITAPSDYKD